MNNDEIKILIVEDDPQIRNFLTFVLKTDGFNYETASTGNMALNIITSEKIDLIILDLGLPDMDGIDIINEIRKWSEKPIIVVSARDQDKEKAKALDSGADDYLTKPFYVMELTARIRVSIRHLKRNESQNIKKYILLAI